MMRKETILMSKEKLLNDAPFYAWDCISLSIKNKWDIYLIIKNEKVMTDFLKLLIYRMDTLDGQRGTALPFKQRLYKLSIKEQQKNSKMTDYQKVKIQNELNIAIMRKVFYKY